MTLNYYLIETNLAHLFKVYILNTTSKRSNKHVFVCY